MFFSSIFFTGITILYAVIVSLAKITASRSREKLYVLVCKTETTHVHTQIYAGE